MREHFRSLLFFLACTFCAAGLGGHLTSLGMRDGWYARLARPEWTPPGWVFGPVWTVLYIAMALAAWLTWLTPPDPWRTRALACFFVQLALNVGWSGVFFALHQPGWAVLEISALWLAILAFTLCAQRCRAATVWLLAPYLVWVSFAAALNVAIWRLQGG